jgi:hypothetical protein
MLFGVGVTEEQSQNSYESWIDSRIEIVVSVQGAISQPGFCTTVAPRGAHNVGEGCHASPEGLRE